MKTRLHRYLDLPMLGALRSLWHPSKHDHRCLRRVVEYLAVERGALLPEPTGKSTFREWSLAGVMATA